MQRMSPDFEHFSSQKYSIYTKYSRFALRLAFSEIKHVQGRRKSEMQEMTPN